MTSHKAVVLVSATAAGYGLLHTWKPETFGWKDQTWLPAYSAAYAAASQAGGYGKINPVGVALSFALALALTSNMK